MSRNAMRGEDVYCSKWSNREILFDNGDFSAIWGFYDGGSRRCLGLRWDGDGNDAGFPKTFAHPVWFVVPRELTQGVLNDLLAHTLQGGRYFGDEDKIRAALKEFLCNVYPRPIRFVVALYAAANRGKTQTLNALINLLLQDGVLLEEIKNAGSSDRCVVVNCKGIIVGVGTGGDYGDVVKDNFKLFEKHRCDIAFCATRKRSDSSSWATFWEKTAGRSVRMEAVAKTEAKSCASDAEMHLVNNNQARNLLEKYL